VAGGNRSGGGDEWTREPPDRTASERRQSRTDPVGSGAERQRYRAAPIGDGRASDPRSPSVTECGIAE
jgi:hypothetical protein